MKDPENKLVFPSHQLKPLAITNDKNDFSNCPTFQLFLDLSEETHLIVIVKLNGFVKSLVE